MVGGEARVQLEPGIFGWRNVFVVSRRNSVSMGGDEIPCPYNYPDGFGWDFRSIGGAHFVAGSSE